jgi:hypothetical protein
MEMPRPDPNQIPYEPDPAPGEPAPNEQPRIDPPSDPDETEDY